MLSLNNINNAIQINEKLAALNIRIEPQAGSLVNILNSSVNQVINSDYTNPINLYAETEADAYSTKEEIIPSDHSVTLVEITKISKAISNHLYTARNVVSPLILELYSAIKNQVENIEHTILESIKIKQVGIPELIQNADILEIINKYKTDKTFANQPSINFESMSFNDIKELLKNPAIDNNQLNFWVADKSEGFFTIIWNTVFANTTDLNSTHRDFISLIGSADGLNVAIAVFLMSLKLIDNPPENAGVSLARYNDIVYSYLGISSAKISDDVERYTLSIKNNRFITNIDYDESTIYVNKTIYQQFKDKELHDNLLLGVYQVRNRAYPTLEEIERYQEVYSNAFKSWFNAKLVIENNRKFDTYLYFIREESKKLLLNNKEKIFKPFYANEQEITVGIHQYVEATKNIENYLECLRMSDIEDIYSICINIVAKQIFFFTDAFNILMFIKEIKSINKEIGIKDAALLATIKHITQFVMRQLNIYKD